MKKIYILTLLILMAMPLTLAAQSTSDSVLLFYINKWEEAVLAKNKKDMLALCDSGYKAEQLEGIYKGDVQMFIDGLHCGDQQEKMAFKCVELKDIDAISVAEIKVVRGDYWVYFLVRSGKATYKTWSMFPESKKDGKKAFGFRGPVG